MSLRQGGQIAAALLLDAVFGEPPEAVHPTVLIGRVISAFEKRALRLQSPRSRRLVGVVLTLSVPSLVFVSTRRILGAAPGGPGWMIGTALISTTLSMRGLGEAAGDVERGLREGPLVRARAQVGRFVGRARMASRKLRSAGRPSNRSRRTRATVSLPQCSTASYSGPPAHW